MKIDYTGTLNIDENRLYDVTDYATVNVNVPASAVCSGTKQITSNGDMDVTGYARVSVQVNTEVSGNIEITSNGHYDVSGLASVDVNVPASGGSQQTSSIVIDSSGHIMLTGISI